MLQKWKKHRPGWFEQKCRGKFGTYPDKISELDQFRRPEEREFTSLPTNFDRDRLDEIAVFKDFELQKFGTNAEDVKENPIRNWGGPIDQIRNVYSNHPSARASFNTNFSKWRAASSTRTSKFACTLNFKWNISLLNETLIHIELEVKDPKTDFLKEEIASKQAENAKLKAISIKELKIITSH